MIIDHFDKNQFLRDYWQKKPCIIKGFIKNFEDPIDEHELAGLAQESDIDSRIIAKIKDKWEVTSGPIEDFGNACRGEWTLLVQSVDKQIPEVNELVKLVNFIPHWRMDDVMVSFSIEGAGVGPHIDEYDVFILQGKGKRRWQVGLPNEFETLIPHPKIKQIRGFKAIIDEVLSPGDAVYIPPNHPHNGIAMEACINYSLGFRAMTNYELLNGLFDSKSFKSSAVSRYRDPAKSVEQWASKSNSSHKVSELELKSLKENMVALLTADSAQQAIMQTLSNQHLVRDILIDEEQFSPQDIDRLFEQNAILYPLLGLRPIYTDQHHTSKFCFYADGECFEITPSLQDTCINFITSDHYVCEFVNVDRLSEQDKQDWKHLIKNLINLGLWIAE